MFNCCFWNTLGIWLNSELIFTGAIHLPNQHCEPRPTLVALGHPHYNFFPFFVILHRCGGSCGTLSPTVKECVPTVYTDVPISHFPININSGGLKTVIEKNHTSCGCRCVRKANECISQYEEWNENNCFCKCLYNNSDPPTPCPIGYTWNRNACRCECINAPHVCGASQVRIVCKRCQKLYDEWN